MRYLTLCLALTGTATLVSCGGSSVTSPTPRFLVGAGGNFGTITDALRAAESGDVIQVLPGTYGERVVVATPGIRLQADHAVLDGAAPGLGGTGVGIRIASAPNVEVSGFTIRNFERGIVLENTSNDLVRNNEVLNSTSKSAPPFVVGTTPFEGIVLIASRNIEVTGNFSHDNGCAGLMLTGGTAGSRVQGNRFTGNGSQVGTTG